MDIPLKVTTHSIYHWDYDRRLPNKEVPFLTFSIAIFQWQPKSSGKGLKKINVCRVNGYAMDPQSMYAKAHEICDRLTAEGANAASPPKWLQKQYSVPKPPGLIVGRLQVDLPGQVVQAIRMAVMKRTLLPEGFVRGKGGTYLRADRDQIHLIDFQPAVFGHEYFVNLGFHYQFLPPLFARKKIKVADYCEIDCGLRARIEQFTKSGQARFEYGTDRGHLQLVLEQNAVDALRIFRKEAGRLSDPIVLLRRADCRLNMRFVRPWSVLDNAFAPFLALHLGRRQVAIREFERLVADSDGSQALYYKKLLAMARAEGG